MIIVVCGLPGTGKTFFATSLAKRLNAVYIGSDEIRFSILQNRTYSLQEKQTIYNHMISRLRMAIEKKRVVVLDGTFYKERLRLEFAKATEPKHVVFIEIIADDNVARSRVRSKRDHSEADEKVYDLIKSEWEPLGGDHLVLDSTSQNVNTMVEKTRKYIQR